MQLKALGCPGTLNGAFGGNSSVAWSCTASFISLCDLSRVPSVSPLKSKPGWALSLQGWMRCTMKLTADHLGTTPALLLQPEQVSEKIEVGKNTKICLVETDKQSNVQDHVQMEIA